MTYEPKTCTISLKRWAADHVDLVVSTDGHLLSYVKLTAAQVDSLYKGESVISPVKHAFNQHSKPCPRGLKFDCPNLANENLLELVTFQANTVVTTDPVAIQDYAMKLRLKAIELEAHLSQLVYGKEDYA